MSELNTEQEVARPPTSAFEERLRSWMESSERRFEVKQAAGDTLEISMLDIIGEDWWTGGGITSKKVQEKLAGLPKAKTVKVLLNSPGGDAFEGLAIQALLRRHGGRVEVEVVGLAASAASIIAMAGDSIAMHEGSLMMVHEPWTFAIGNATEMRTAAEFLDKVNASGLDVYTRRTGRERADVAALVAAETWMTAHEAVQERFATEVIEGAGPERAPATKARAAAAAFMSARPRAAVPPREEPLPAPEPPAAKPAAAPQSFTPAHPEKKPMSELTPTPVTPSIARALGLPAGATETDIIAAASRTRELEVQIQAITGVQASGEALGAVRGLKAKADRADTLEQENLQLKAERDQQAFDALILSGQSHPVKLSPASAKHYQDRFTAAKDQGRGSEVVSDLRGFLAVAPTIIAERKTPPKGESGSSGAGHTYQGKTYAQLKFAERAALSRAEPELYRAMKNEFDAAQA